MEIMTPHDPITGPLALTSVELKTLRCLSGASSSCLCLVSINHLVIHQKCLGKSKNLFYSCVVTLLDGLGSELAAPSERNT